MRILLAEDSTLLREALTALLERLGHAVVATADTAPRLVAAYEELGADGRLPELVLTDVRMPPTNRADGLAAALRIRRDNPGQPVMVLSQYIADTYARELLTLPGGAVGYLLKDRVNRVHDFARALDTVAGGGTVIDPEVVQHLLTSTAPGPLDALTRREREVLGLMAEGQPNSQIAAGLHLSEASVSKHIGNIFRGLGLDPADENRRVKAVLAYLENSRS
ncbi:MAG TPA: response regulator transcription factor [Gryllotalpicola sp.]